MRFSTVDEIEDEEALEMASLKVRAHDTDDLIDIGETLAVSAIVLYFVYAVVAILAKLFGLWSASWFIILLPILILSGLWITVIVMFLIAAIFDGEIK